MGNEERNISKVVAVLLVLTVVVMIAGMALNISTVPEQKTTEASGKVNLVVSARIAPTPTTGEVTLVVK